MVCVYVLWIYVLYIWCVYLCWAVVCVSMVCVSMVCVSSSGGSYFGLGFALLTVTGEVVRIPQPAVAVVCRVQDVYVADHHLVAHTHTHTHTHTHICCI